MNRSVKSLLALGAVACVMTGASSGQTSAPAGELDARIEHAVAAGVEFILARIEADGRCAGEFAPDDSKGLFGGRTALCAYALLSAGAVPGEPPLARAISWLEKAELKGTYPVAMRACAYAALRDDRSLALLEKDVRSLVAAGRDGGYSYRIAPAGAAAAAAPEPPDNSNSQMAALAVWTASQRGVEAPAAYWQAVQRYWTGQQDIDGGWGYRLAPGMTRAKAYGSMTAAGLATMHICLENLSAEQFVRCTAAESKPIDEALRWLDRNFTADANPGKGVEWYAYWLYSLQRAAAASGHRYFAGRDWYSEGASRLLPRQHADGAWGYGDRVAETAFAVLFLARGRSPVFVSKLRYPGKWNSRPRDAANLADWLGRTFERPMTWQIVNIDSPVAQWLDGQILYVSGAGPWEPTDSHVAALREFALKGGLLLFEAACNNGDFTLDVQRVCKRIFPAYPLRRLPDDHPLYAAHFSPKGVGDLSAVSNGIRLLAIHCPRELSLSLQLNRPDAHRPIYELLGNIYVFATDKGTMRPRGQTPWPEAKPFTPAASLRVAKVRYGGNYDPEPLALQRLAVVMGNRHRIKLDVSDPVDLAELDAAKWPVAAMTGTEEFALTTAQAAGLKQYFAAGGTLVADAAGGSRAFAAAVEKQILNLLPGSQSGLISLQSPLYTAGPEQVGSVSFRRDYALALGAFSREPRLKGVALGNRLKIIYSPEDLTAGLIGYPCYNLRGYSPDSAAALMTNILCHAAGMKPKEPGVRK